MYEFKKYHPIVNFTYFIFVITFSMFFMHPISLSISIICSFIYSIMLSGRKAIKFNFFYILPLLIISALINPIFNHEGATILTYFPNGSPLTAESVFYGFAAAGMIVSVICWFSCFNIIITSDKFIYLFGKMMPSLSLVFSMILRLVPRIKRHIKNVSNAQKCVGRDISKGNTIKRAKIAITVLSGVITWVMENSIETADSMRSRGYGLPNRTSFSIFKFSNRDKKLLICICVLGLYVLIGNMIKGMYFTYYPSVKGVELSIYSISLFCAYFLLCIIPIIIEVWEDRKWKVMRSKI